MRSDSLSMLLTQSCCFKHYFFPSIFQSNWANICVSNSVLLTPLESSINLNLLLSVSLSKLYCYQFIAMFIKNCFSRHRSSQICYYGYYWLYWFMNLNLPTPIPFQKLHIILNLYFRSILLNPKTIMFPWNLW